MEGLAFLSGPKEEVALGYPNRAPLIIHHLVGLCFKIPYKLLKFIEELEGVEYFYHEIGCDFFDDHLSELNLSDFYLESIVQG